MATKRKAKREARRPKTKKLLKVLIQARMGGELQTFEQIKGGMFRQVMPDVLVTAEDLLKRYEIPDQQTRDLVEKAKEV